MGFEKYFKFYDGFSEGQPIRAGQSQSFIVSCQEFDQSKKHKLYIAGETALNYLWKNEPDYSAQYRSITDALDAEHAYKDQYCLNLSSKNYEEYIRRVYMKVMWPPRLTFLKMNPVPEEWRFGVRARAEKLDCLPGGYIRMAAEVRYAKPGMSRRYAGDEPDESHVIDIPCGSYGWTLLERSLVLDKDKTASVGIWFEGTGYRGQAYIESPFLSAGGYNLLPDFTVPVPDEEDFCWSSQYLSRKEWPEFRVSARPCGGGTRRVIFEGEIFERCHRASEWSVEIPDGLLSAGETRLTAGETRLTAGETGLTAGETEFTIELTSGYHDPLPYTIRELGVIEQPRGPVSILACPYAAASGSEAAILIKTGHDGIKADFSCDGGGLEGEREYYFEKKGLHVIKLRCGEPGSNAAFSLTADGAAAYGEVERIVKKEPDGILTGTGDMIYIEQDEEAVTEYLCWYFSNGIGNMLAIRPAYRWSGTRVLNLEMFRWLIRILNELGVKYAHMIDGRELQGIDSNPTDDMLCGAGYLGSQNHENDNPLFYGYSPPGESTRTQEQFGDMALRIYRERGQHMSPGWGPSRLIFENENVWNWRNPNTEHDVRAAYDASVKMLRAMRERRGQGCIMRHTGPSVMFKYFYDAGYKWVGAETMYSSMEPQMAFLRGAALYGGSTDLGVHHAVQWSSSPHDAPEHGRRYRLALYVSYMQGATEINTEEGLWHMEEYYSHHNRFGSACMDHLCQQRDFFKYVSSHTRSGVFYAPMAIIHGRFDGWHSFGYFNSSAWGFRGENECDAEKSWGLLKIIYPLSNLGEALYRHGCATDKPQGYYSGTPYGNIDILPAESGAELYKKYKSLAFLGYNHAVAEDLDKLHDYCESGGHALISRAHFATATKLSDIESYRLSPLSHRIAPTDGAPSFHAHACGGMRLDVCENPAGDFEALLKTDDGVPLLVRYQIGLGSLTLLNANAYPAHPAANAIYGDALKAMLARRAESEHVYPVCDEKTGCAVYDQKDGSRHIYYTPVDWYNDPAALRCAKLRVGGHSYPVELQFGVMVKAVVNNETAAWPLSEDGEVLDAGENAVTVQGTGKTDFMIAAKGRCKRVRVDFSGSAVRQIEV